MAVSKDEDWGIRDWHYSHSGFGEMAFRGLEFSPDKGERPITSIGPTEHDALENVLASQKRRRTAWDRKEAAKEQPAKNLFMMEVAPTVFAYREIP